MRAILLIGLLSVSAIAAESDLSRTLKAVEARYNNASSLQALFHEDYMPPGRPHWSEAGTITLSKPGRMRWEYSQPKGKLYISDGKQVTLYRADENRAEISPLKQTDDSQAPIAFLLGKLHFEREFRNITASPDSTGSTRISCEPKSENMSYSKLEFLVSGQNQIQEVKVFGFDKSLMIYRFEQEKLNVPVDPKVFQFKAPAGAEIVELGK